MHRFTADFEYPKLKSASTEIRLLELQPSDILDSPIHAVYHVTNLESAAQSYETLSYAWGDLKADEQKTIYVNSVPVSVSSGLFSAMHRLRLPTSGRESYIRRLWIDQLCINQSNLQEKMQQVSMMGKIYSQCSSCNIWLGDLGDVSVSDAEDALDLLVYYAGKRREPESWLADQRRRDKALDLINHIVTLPWWYRVWTVQEAVLPPSATMHWGRCQISWELTSEAALNIVRGTYPPWMREYHSQGNLDPFTGFVIGMLKARHDNHCGLLVRWRYRKATNPLDKVYALLGFRDDLLRELTSVGSCDYTLEPSTLFARVTADMIRAYGSLEPIIGSRGESRATEGLPSWASDFAGARPGAPALYAFWEHDGIYIHRGYTAGAGIKGPAPVVEHHRVLCLTGICVDSVEIVEQRTPQRREYMRNTVSMAIEDILSERKNTGRQLVREWVSTRSAGVDLARYDKCVEDLEKLLRGELIPGTSHGDDWVMRCRWVEDMLSNQAVFITSKGLLGLGPLSVKPGQEVWVLTGSDFPFILEPLAGVKSWDDKAEGSDYSLVADCFVRGIMMGEAMKEESISSRKVRSIRVL